MLPPHICSASERRSQLAVCEQIQKEHFNGVERELFLVIKKTKWNLHHSKTKGKAKSQLCQCKGKKPWLKTPQPTRSSEQIFTMDAAFSEINAGKKHTDI